MRRRKMRRRIFAIRRLFCVHPLVPEPVFDNAIMPFPNIGGWIEIL